MFFNVCFFFFSSRRRHTRLTCDWSSDVCSSDLLPVLFVIFNNRAWNAVKRSVKAYAPEGWSVRTGVMPLSELDPAPDYELVARACGGWGERVEDPAALPDMLDQALRVVRHEKRQALLNVVCKKP